MYDYVKKPNSELSDYAAKTGLADSKSVLEFLWENHLYSDPIDDGTIRKSEESILPVFQELSLESADALNSLISNVCIAYQRAAFFRGIYIGMQLGTFMAEKSAPHK